MITRHESCRDNENFLGLMDQLWAGSRAIPTAPMDVFEKEGILHVRLSVPGVKPEDLDVNLENGVLTIQGEVKKNEEFEGAHVYRIETAAGVFSRSLRLNAKFDPESIQATYDHGVLDVQLKRNETELKRKVEIRVANPN